MRMKKQIDDLTEAAKSISFKGDGALASFRHKLREAVAENFGYSVGKSLEFDFDTGIFFWEERELIGVVGDSLTARKPAGGKMGIDVKEQFVIDPTKPLAEEFARVEAERAAFKVRRHEVARALIKIGMEAL